MPPILLSWPTTSKADADGITVEVKPSLQHPITFCCCMTDGSRGTVWQNGIWHGSKYEDVCWLLLNIYGDQTVNVSTVRWWVVHFSSGNIDVINKPYSRQPCTAVTPQNEEHLNHLISMNQLVMTRELWMELNIQCIGNNGGNIGILQSLH